MLLSTHMATATNCPTLQANKYRTDPPVLVFFLEQKTANFKVKSSDELTEVNPATSSV